VPQAGAQLQALDLPVLTTPLPAGAGYQPQYSPGLLAHLPAVVAQFVEARRLSPLRVLLTGPPYSGARPLLSRACADAQHRLNCGWQASRHSQMAHTAC
jgi:hypothetical protein